ncbi:hypothetical protein [Actinoplanes aureus]|uniref:DUF3040 domain-containing protein n=1 Tax=Actinoplanes aureus TaxID=2792083 RepID=A0A931G538_9ACTN|nr:hypothetical protein [Actinoplanes aureus]MBG0565874.1 hypothetical protein [Actinoplanes aureus]
MATRDTRREFDEIVGRLTADYPSLTRPVRVLPRRVVRILLAVGGGLLWAGLSVLMVVAGTVGVVITCLIVGAVLAVALTTARRRRPPRSGG